MKIYAYINKGTGIYIVVSFMDGKLCTYNKMDLNDSQRINRCFKQLDKIKNAYYKKEINKNDDK